MQKKPSSRAGPNKICYSENSNMPPKDSARSLRDMKEMLTNLPQFQDLKAKVCYDFFVFQYMYACTDVYYTTVFSSSQHRTGVYVYF